VVISTYLDNSLSKFLSGQLVTKTEPFKNPPTTNRTSLKRYSFKNNLLYNSQS